MQPQETHIITYVEDNELVIDNIFVAPEERRQGKAKEMIQKVINDAFLDSEINIVSLYAYPQDESITQDELIDFYKKIGFEEDANEIGLMYYEV